MASETPAALLTTKLLVPRVRLGAVLRPRLLEELEEGLRQGRRLTLVAAPAGFGKSTLLAVWLYARSRRIAEPAGTWLALDADDGDPARFLTYLLGALQGAVPEIGRTVAAGLQAPVTGLGRGEAHSGADEDVWCAPLLAALVQDLTALLRPLNDPLILVLDDYHELASPAVDRLVSWLLDHAPPTLHIAIATRSEPALAIARLRACGAVTEVRGNDLRFTAAEAAEFLNGTMNLQVSAASEAALLDRTEGWPAALQLAALSLRTMGGREAADFVAGFGGSDRHVADYLVEEVLQRQPFERRAFLLRTSILRRMCAPLCAALASESEWGYGRESGTLGTAQAMLEECDRQNLFLIPLDHQRKWYRYHHLFAEHLQAHLRRESPTMYATLHRCAGDWYAAAGEGDEAMHHLLAASDSQRAAIVAEQYGVQMIGGSRLATFFRWCEQLDPSVIRQRPFLCAGLGWAYVLTGESEQALAWVAAGANALDHGQERGEVIVSQPDGRRIGPAEVRGHLQAVRAYAARLQRDGEAVARYSQAALADLPADADTVRCTLALNWGLLEMEQGHDAAALAAFAEAYRSGSRNAANLFVALSALGLQGDLHVRAGELNEAERFYNQVIAEGELSRAQTPPAVGVGYFGLAQVHLWRGEFAAARRRVEEGMRWAEQLAFAEALDEVLLLGVRIALGAHEYSEAAARLAAAAKRSEQAGPRSRLDRGWALLRATLALAQGDLAAAGAWAAAQFTAGTPPDSTRANEYLYHQELLLCSRIRLAEGDPAALPALLKEIGAQAAMPLRCESAILRAQAYLAVGADQGQGNRSEEQALAALAEAVALAAPQRLRLPFLTAQPLPLGLLRKLGYQGPHTEFVASLLPQSSGNAPAHPALAEPLSEREQEVLSLLAAGLTNSQIAEILIVAPSTVKTHVNRILAKLAAANRTQAVARAREWGLITN
jgi:LuxR family maltose regulon positive regulatory protein